MISPGVRVMEDQLVEILTETAASNDPIRGSRHAAAIVMDKDLVSLATNVLKTHPMQKKYSKNPKSIYLHAEIAAIAYALNRIRKSELQGCCMYVVRARFTDSGEVIRTDSKPCKGCADAISAFNLETYFSNGDGELERFYG